MQRWADLGAGQGVFTRALASLLPPRSVIYAIDANKQALDKLSFKSEVSVQKIVGDLTDEQIIPSPLDGILLANAVHYVRNKRELFNMLLRKLDMEGRIIVVEYDLEKANPWVPYPMPFRSLVEHTQSLGLRLPKEIGRVPSRLNTSEIYSALIVNESSQP
jgi:ubiquinone/menaquinone biosynthesis C-methylase UbiE